MSYKNKIYISDLNNYSFYIPNYQRGYKWSKKNIEDLLNDINSIDNDNKKDHCLHNLTIIENDGKYEVVDGQQRLTTIFLLLKYLKNKLKSQEEIYNLDYQIREETKHFINNKLETIINNISNYDNGTAIFNSVEDTEIDIKKEDGTIEKSSYNKQDIYFICDALFCMHQWFTDKDNTDNKIYDNLQKVYFYKHELTDIKGETVFANLNSGRVPLTYIELIKADLIINISEEKNKSLKNDILLNEIRINIGRLWDEMESFLAQDEVWYWTAANNKSANKLSLLFDLINIKTFKDYKDILENNKENNKTSNDILNKIKDYYYTIKDWYYDNDMYHLVGIAVNIGLSINRLFEIKEDSKDKLKNKKELKNEIIQSIIDNLSLKIDDYEDLNYQNRKYIEKIMLLLNCLEGFKYDEQLSFNKGFRYRFDLHNKEEWSIEHIFPQNATKENYKSCILDLIFLFNSEKNIKELENISKILDIDVNSIKDNEDIEELKELINKKEDIDINAIKDIIKHTQSMDIQSIGNLALLSKNINSSLQNYIFEEKRTILLKKISEENIFVPPLTLKIFSKNFDGADRTKVYWTPNDFVVYLNYQKAQLEKILNLLKIIKDKK